MVRRGAKRGGGRFVSKSGHAERSAGAPRTESLNQELRLATLGLDLRQSQEGIVRLTDDARALTESVQVLASGFDELKSDVSAARIDAAAARARIEERVQEVANLGKPVLLGDPALRKVAHQGTSSSDVEASDGGQPTTTGGLVEVSPPADGTCDCSVE